MSPDPVDVSPQKFSAASAIFGAQIHGELGKAISGLPGGLGTTAGMAGSDPGGVEWAESYDRSARAAADALVDLDIGSTKLAMLLEQSGFNHGQAESASDPHQAAPTAPDTTNYDTAPPAAIAVPTAKGGSAEPSPGDWILDHTVHYVWVNGDQDKLRAAAAAWTTAATTVEGAGNHLPEAFTAIHGQQSPELGDALAVVTDYQQQIGEVAGACHDIAKACTDFATHVQQAHDDVVAALAEFVAETVGLQLAAAALTVFTFGGSEVAAQVAEVAMVTNLANKISEIIRILVAAAKTVAQAIGKVVTRATNAVKRLASLKSSKPLKSVAEDAKAAKTEADAAAARTPPTRPEGVPDLAIDDTQFGHKVGKHAQDFGLNPGNAADRAWVRDHIEGIAKNPEEVRQGPWNPERGGATDNYFYRVGNDVVVAKRDGTFVTVLQNGVENGWYKGATTVK